MIVVDSSAVVAIVRNEPEAADFSLALARADRRVMSAATYLECALVLITHYKSRSAFDDWLLQRRIDVIAVDHSLAQLAADTFARYGKGRHPAALNFGDCFSYALAKSLNAPLLFKGNDFAQTDITPAVA